MEQDDLFNRVWNRHQATAAKKFPSSQEICSFSTSLLHWLFPESIGKWEESTELLHKKFLDLQQQCCTLLGNMQAHLPQKATDLCALFFGRLPSLEDLLSKDAEAILQGDPAALNQYEVIRTYPGFYALAFYRLAHEFHRLGVPLLPRTITEFAHNKTGIDIHPGAEIGPYCCIDHGSGIVIGETAEIGSHVKIYQGVTLGALSVDKTMASSKRHPTIGDHVVLYAGATILGGDTHIGHHSIIGGNVWLIKSVPPHSRIYYKADEHIAVSSASVHPE